MTNRKLLAAAQDAVRRQDEFLKSAQDSDRRLKESLQVESLQKSTHC